MCWRWNILANTLCRLAQDSPLRFPWKNVQSELDDAKLPYAIHHYSRKGKAHLSDTISAQAERLAPGYTTMTLQKTCSYIYHVRSGEGKSTIITVDGQTTEIEWKNKDTFAVSAWSQLQHTCASSGPAYLFAINDRPMLESLGLFGSNKGRGIWVDVWTAGLRGEELFLYTCFENANVFISMYYSSDNSQCWLKYQISPWNTRVFMIIHIPMNWTRKSLNAIK